MRRLMIMEYILHIDTSGATGIVMLAGNGEVIAMERNEAEREHAGTVNGMIDTVMQSAGIQLSQLAAIAVCSGPGSYTGLRIGLATAKGLCYVLDKPLIMQNKLDLLVDNTANMITMSILPARIGEYFVAIYDAERNELLPAQHADTEEIIRLAGRFKVQSLIGEASEDVISIIKYIKCHLITEINLYFWAESSISLFYNKQFSNIATAEPLYLKSVYIHKKTF